MSPEYLLDVSDEEMDRLFKAGVDAAIQRQKIMGFPVARYDKESGRVYLEYPDGRCEYVP